VAARLIRLRARAIRFNDDLLTLIAELDLTVAPG
jgi:hypothetical protein